MIVSQFVRPNGEIHNIVAVQVENGKFMIVLENGLARWFSPNELYIDGSRIFYKTQ